MGTVATIVEKEIATLPEPLRASVAMFAEQIELPDTLDNADAATLVRLVAISEFAARILQRERDWFFRCLDKGELQRDRLLPILASFDVDATASEDDKKRELRRFRNRQLLAILWRESRGEANVRDTLSDLSALADRLIHVAAGDAAKRLQGRFGEVRNGDGEAAEFLVVAMGKLGGRELNFSSDVDLIFLYTFDGNSDGERQLSAQEYFSRVARHCVAMLEPVTADGFVYRVDTRLRPFGESGPPVVSFAALESYLLQHGRSWERYAFIKARVIFGGHEVASDLMRSLIEPFVYRRYLDYGVFESLREMKSLIETEVGRRDLAENIKLGPGGIREVEFIVQSLQLVRGGADSSLRGAELRTVLSALAGHGGLEKSVVDTLASAYFFLRQLENCVQAMRDQQTHDLPANDDDRARVALAMGYPGFAELAAELRIRRDFISHTFDGVVFRTEDDQDETDREDQHGEELGALWDREADVANWARVLSDMRLPNADVIAGGMAAFAKLTSSRQIDSISRDRLIRLLPSLLALIGATPDPETTLHRVLDIVSNILRRSAYVALLNENPGVLQRLVDLCSASAYLAEEISRFPLLLDEMLDPRLYSQIPGKSALEGDLSGRLARTADDDSETQVNRLVQFQRAALFRIAIADFNGSLPLMHVSDRLTELAEVVLNAALRIAWDDLVARYGQPKYRIDDIVRPAGLGVIAYGKLAGMEMSYSSDLDLVFLHDSGGSDQFTDGENPIDNNRFFSRLVRRLVHFLTTQTGSGSLYEVDTRLRPSGRSGLLVSSIDGFERYQEENAWTWEHQALLRSRPVAGSSHVAREFGRIRSETLRDRVRRDSLLEEVQNMRRKMRKHLDASDHDRFDLKQGEGGIGDLEFLVQYLVLKNAQEHPAVIHYTDNIRQLGTLEAAGFLNESETRSLQAAYRNYRQRLHQRALDDKDSVVDIAEFAEERQAVRQAVSRHMRT